VKYDSAIHKRRSIGLNGYEFVVMPNHIHGIVWIVAGDDETTVGGDRPVAPTSTRSVRRPYGQ